MKNTHSLRILIFTPFRYPGQGGAETHITMLSKGLLEAGQEVKIISPSMIPRPLRVIILRIPSVLLNWISKGWGILWFYRIVSLWASWVLKRILRVVRYDVVNVQNAGLVKAAKMSASKLCVPVVLTVHGDLTNEQLSENRINANSFAHQRLLRMEISAYRNADRIVAVDSRLRKYVEQFMADSDNLEIIRNFVDTNFFSPALHSNKKISRAQFGISDQKKVILCPRRLVKKNGVKYAVLSLSQMVNRLDRKDVLLVLAGEGDEKSTIQQIIDAERLQDRTVLLGTVEYTDMGALYSISDVVIIPSIMSAGVEEATSLAALEAMSAGVPVIASCIGGLKELIRDGENGILVPEKDPVKLAKAIIRILDNQSLRESLIIKARQGVVLNHSHAFGAQQFLRAYKEAAGRLQNFATK